MPYTVTERRRFSYGSKMMDTCLVDTTGGGDYYSTQGGNVDYVNHERPGATSISEVTAVSINSITASNTEDDAGFIHVDTDTGSIVSISIGQ